MPPTRSHRRTLHLLVPSPFPTSSSATAPLPSSSPPSPSGNSPPPPLKKPSRKVLALAREMAAERGEILLLDPSSSGSGLRGVGALSEAKSVKGAREWNGLLCWARKKRGPQWDAATQMWQVDFLSPEYYEPSLSVPPPPAAETPLVPPPQGRSTTDPTAPETSGHATPQPEKGHSGGTSGLLDAHGSSSRSSRRRG